MIKINNNAIVATLIFRKTCCTIVLTNYEKCPVELLNKFSDAFVTNTTTYYPDMVSVVPIDANFPHIRTELYEVCSRIKMENF